MSKYVSLFILTVMLILSAACTRNDAQREFEREAYQGHDSNITETNFQGEVSSVDENDWRTSPLYQGLVRIIPPYPNPVGFNQQIQFDVDIIGIQSVSGLEVFTRLQDGSSYSLYQQFETLQPGLTSFQINPAELSWDGSGSPEGARGYSRIFIFDGRGQMISYGDILVE